MSTISLRSIMGGGQRPPAQAPHARPTTLEFTDHSTGTVKRHRLRKPPQQSRSSSNLLDASVSDKGTFTLQQHQSENPLADFRRRLARKASTFSLRTRRRQGEHALVEAVKEQEKLKELVLLGNHKDTLQPQQVPEKFDLALEKDQDLGRNFARLPQNTVHQLTRTSSATTVRVWDQPETRSAKELPSLPSATALPQATVALQDLIRKSQETYITQEVAGGKICVNRMASEQAQPPVPYTRLKEITETACEAALSGVESYIHTDTEKWNTTIINSILGALVQETTQPAAAGSSAPTQPQFKYVVNSTIIQHAASASSSAGDDSKKTTGRRGMHAASGAYWNNEKDGMWSFKYPGADSKGLDVVVGIIWVWVG